MQLAYYDCHYNSGWSDILISYNTLSTILIYDLLIDVHNCHGLKRDTGFRKATGGVSELRNPNVHQLIIF